jgi:hypothetical protein
MDVKTRPFLQWGLQTACILAPLSWIVSKANSVADVIKPGTQLFLSWPFLEADCKGPAMPFNSRLQIALETILCPDVCTQ